jgi:hypothetical protein
MTVISTSFVVLTSHKGQAPLRLQATSKGKVMDVDLSITEQTGVSYMAGRYRVRDDTTNYYCNIDVQSSTAVNSFTLCGLHCDV